MRSWRKGLTIAAATAAVTSGLVTWAVAQSPAPAAKAAPKANPANVGIARIAGKPDFSGIWEANNTANWDLLTHESRPMAGQPGITPNSVVSAAPVLALGTLGWIPPGQGVVDGNTIPYLPWAAARKKENQDHWLDRDPEVRCFSPGIPRAMYMPYPFQIVESGQKIQMIYEYEDVQRTIHLNKMEDYPNNAWLGYSVGHWEGDTLVTEVTDFNDATWFDRSGDFHSDAMKVTERFTPDGPNAIQYVATINDPQVFSRSWTIRMPLYRHLEQNAQLMEFRCVPMVEELLYGHLRKEQLVKHWEGATMNIDITRKIPPGESVFERYVSGDPPAGATQPAGAAQPAGATK